MGRWRGGALVIGSVAVLAAGGAFATPSSAQSESTGTISGVITQASDGSAAANVCAEVYSATQTNFPATSTCSDSTGHYSLSGISPGQYLIQFVDGDTVRHDIPQWYQDQPASSSANFVSVTAGSTASNINASMVEGGWITGQITDASTGKPISNICSTVLDSGWTQSGPTANPSYPGVYYQACTDSTGKFVTGGLAPGEYYVQFNGYGYSEQAGDSAYSVQWYNGQTVQSSANQVTVTAGQATSSINGSLQPTVAISGKVTDSNGPVAYTHVEFSSNSTFGSYQFADAYTANDGTYTAYVPAGTYTIEFAPPSNGPDQAQWYNDEPDQAHADTLTVVAGTPQTGVDAVLVAGASISGKVTDSASGNPVANMPVGACPTTYTEGVNCQYGYTQSDGTYSISGLVAGSWTVEFWGSEDQNYLNQYYPNAIADNSLQPQSVTVKAGQAVTGIDDSAVQGSTFSGTLTDAETGGDLVGICVSVVPTDETNGYSAGWACTNTGGQYTTSGVPTGSYLLEYTNYGGRYITQWYNDQPTQTQANAISVTQPTAKTKLDQTMQLGGNISGTVTSADGSTPLDGICVEVYPVTDGTPSTSGLYGGCTDSSGQYSTASLAAGKYDVEFIDNAGTYTTQYWKNVSSLSSATPVTVTEGQTTANISAAMASQTVPGAPTNVQATAGDKSATVTFDAPTSDGGSAITGYTITPNPACASCSGLTSSSTSATITGLTNGTNYTFTVAATNSQGTGSASAASNSVTPTASSGGTQTVPGAPTNISATVDVSTVTVAYTAPASDGNSAITGYKVVPSPACTGCAGLSPTGTSTQITGLTDGTAYTFKVSAVNSVGTGPASVSSNAVTPTAKAVSPVNGTTSSSKTPAVASSGGTTATASGGAGTVTVSQYPSDPTAKPNYSSTNAYLDVSESKGSSFSSVVVKDCNLKGANSLFWWNPAAGSGGAWQQVLGDPTNTSGLPGCLSVTLDAKSSPNLTQLGGTIFGAAITGGGGDTTTTPPTTTPPTTVPPRTAPSTGTAPAPAVCSAKLPSGSVVGMAQTADGGGYWIASNTGQVANCGDAPALGNGSAGTVAIADAPSGNGYWLATATGQVKAFGSAVSYGSLPTSLHLNGPIVAMAADPASGGYWLLGSDGGVFSFNAPFFGSTGSIRLNRPAVGLEATTDGRGYRFVAADGGVFDYGDAAFLGSMGGRPLAQAVVGMADDPATGGYWLVAADGGIFSFGAPFYGSTGGIPLAKPVVAMTALPAGTGYRMSATDGGIFDFGAAGFEGSSAG